MVKKEMEIKELNEEFDMFEKHGFSDVFHSEYDQPKKYNGLEFKVLRRGSINDCWLCDSPIWIIECNKDIFAAYPVEIIEGLW